MNSRQGILKFATLVVVWLMVSLAFPNVSLLGLIRYDNSAPAENDNIVSVAFYLLSYSAFGTGAAKAQSNPLPEIGGTSPGSYDINNPAAISASPIHFAWDAVDGADHYRVIISAVDGSYVSTSGFITTTTYDFSPPADFDTSKTYKWTVSAFNNNNAIAISSEAYFTYNKVSTSSRTGNFCSVTTTTQQGGKYIYNSIASESDYNPATSTFFADTCQNAQQQECNAVCGQNGYASGSCSGSGVQLISKTGFEVCQTGACTCSGVVGQNGNTITVSNARTCGECESAGGLWCVSINGFSAAYNLQCVSASKGCPSGYTAYAADCPSGLCQEACASYYATTALRLGQLASTSIPIGACYSSSFGLGNIYSAFNSGSGNSNQVSIRQSIPLGSKLCDTADNTCWCTIVGSSTAPATNNFGGTIPGTDRTSHWPPNSGYYVSTSDWPKKSPNDAVCSLRSDATIKQVTVNGKGTSGTTTLIAAGQPITITGKVGYFSDTCNGYTYSCQKFTELQCDSGHSGFLGMEQYKSYKDCSKAAPGLPNRLDAQGQDSSFCWGCLTNIFIDIAGVVGVIFGVPPNVALAAVTFLNQATPAIDGCPVNPGALGASAISLGTQLGNLPSSNTGTPVSTSNQAKAYTPQSNAVSFSSNSATANALATVGVAYALTTDVYTDADSTAYVSQVPSTNYYEHRTQPISAIVVHCTASDFTSTANTFTNSNDRVSAHYVIDTDGKRYAFVPENKIAYHAGISSWGNKSGVNQFSVGIELANDCTNPYTTAQYASLSTLITDLAAKYNVLPHDIVGHADVSLEGKTDPSNLDWSRLPANYHTTGNVVSTQSQQSLSLGLYTDNNGQPGSPITVTNDYVELPAGTKAIVVPTINDQNYINQDSCGVSITYGTSANYGIATTCDTVSQRKFEITVDGGTNTLTLYVADISSSVQKPDLSRSITIKGTTSQIQANCAVSPLWGPLPAKFAVSCTGLQDGDYAIVPRDSDTNTPGIDQKIVTVTGGALSEIISIGLSGIYKIELSKTNIDTPLFVQDNIAVVDESSDRTCSSALVGKSICELHGSDNFLFNCIYSNTVYSQYVWDYDSSYSSPAACNQYCSTRGNCLPSGSQNQQTLYFPCSNGPGVPECRQFSSADTACQEAGFAYDYSGSGFGTEGGCVLWLSKQQNAPQPLQSTKFAQNVQLISTIPANMAKGEQATLGFSVLGSDSSNVDDVFFTLESPSGIAIENGKSLKSLSSSCPPDCSYAIELSESGVYTYDLEAYDASGNNLLASLSGNFDVAESAQSPSAPQNGEPYWACTSNVCNQGADGTTACGAGQFYEQSFPDQDSCNKYLQSQASEAAAKQQVENILKDPRTSQAVVKLITDARGRGVSDRDILNLVGGAAKSSGGASTGQIAGFALQELGATLASPSWSCDLLRNDVCWSVCGADYQSGPGASPGCPQGGALKSYTDDQYTCSPQSCGSLANYDVEIQVLHGTDILKDDITTTDADGNFSYTFTAPQLDDSVTIVVKVAV